MNNYNMVSGVGHRKAKQSKQANFYESVRKQANKYQLSGLLKIIFTFICSLCIKNAIAIAKKTRNYLEIDACVPSFLQICSPLTTYPKPLHIPTLRGESLAHDTSGWPHTVSCNSWAHQECRIHHGPFLENMETCICLIEI